MKKIFLLCSLFVFCGAFANAQWTNTGDSIPGGPGGNNYLGLINNRNVRIGTTNLNRMIIGSGFAGPNDGRIAVGNELPNNFVATSRFHLHQSSESNEIRFTTDATGPFATDGTTMGISNLGGTENFQIRNREVGNTDIFTNSIAGGNERRFRINEDGNFLIGVPPTGPIPFSQAPESLFNVRGPINGCEFNGSGQNPSTILYGYTAPTGNPVNGNSDGYRFRYDFDYKGTPNRDYLIIEKTDVQHPSRPDGGIVFQNMGTGGQENVSMRLEGTGRTVFGERTGGLLNLQNRVTIKSDPTDAQPAGLRFTNLTSTAVPVSNPGSGVLGVNASGDVIYVESALPNDVTADNGLTFTTASGTTNIQLGQLNSAAGLLNGGELLNDREIPMNGFNLDLYGGGTTGTDKVSIGIPLFTPPAKMAVWNDAENFAVLGVSTANPNGVNAIVGVHGEASTGVQNSMGVRGVARTAGSNTNIGVRGLAENGNTSCLAGDFDILNTTSQFNWGIHSNVVGPAGSTNYGVLGRTDTPNGGVQNIGGDFSATGATTNYGIRASGNSAAAWFTGNVFIGGVLVMPSDQMLKSNINEITNASDIINELTPKTYDYNTSKYPQLGLPSEKQFGLIAHELEEVLPELVTDVRNPEQTDEDGNVISEALDFKGVNYQGLIPILIQGHKEQQEIIEEKDEKIDELEARLDKLEQLVNSLADNSNEALNTRLSDANYVVLEQNVPNPFAEKTTINFNVPEEVKRAQIIFYNEQGKLINTVSISERGAGSLNVFASDLSTGIYTYTLVVDGNIFETKKMVKK